MPGNELRHRAGRSRRLLLAAAALAAGACASSLKIGPPPVERPLDLVTAMATHFGTCLTGALATAAPGEPDPAATPVVHAELFLLGSIDAVGPVNPLAEEIRFVVQPGSTTPLRGPSRLALRGVQLVRLDLPALLDLWRRGDDGNALRVGEESRPLPSGTTCTVSAERGERVEDPDDFLGERKVARVADVSKRFGVAVETGKDAALVTLDLADSVRPTAREIQDRGGGGGDNEDETALPTAALEPRHELVRLASTLEPGGCPIVVVVPSPFHDDARGGRPAPWCAIAVELLPAPTEGDAKAAHAAAVAKVWKEAQDETRETAARTALRPPENVVGLALRRAFENLAPAASSRPTVVYVTTATDASFAGDFALVASDDDLAAWLRELLANFHDPPPDATTAAIGWAVERSAWHHVITQMLSGDPPPEIEATVLRHAGSVGRLATSLEEAVDESGDVASLEKRFTAENLAALEDSSASTRVRAYDWLTPRGLAPAGFDPMAPADDRRRVLEGAEPRRE